ncbi:hypothetical protein LCGC14_1463790 [marine sediment metagenome]|uniref:Homeodomain phBC6A51-type domain-containing protein n=2 Tax=marine sediment metagenome TaxID=412755 RepID=A0A0F9MG56_9ZZZZ
MSDSCNPDSTTGKAIRRKLQKGAKYNYDFVQVASRMVAAGMTEKDIGYVLGVKPTTISKWKQRYAEFALATNSQSSAKQIAVSHLVANGLRSAMGYDYEETDQVLEMVDNPDYDEDDENCKEPKLIQVLKKETRKLKHRPPDKDMLMFFLLNLSDDYHNTRSITIDQTKKQINVNITGKLESSDIRKLAGAAFQTADALDKKSKVIESKIVDVIDGEFNSDSIPPKNADSVKISNDVNKEFLESIVDD